MKYWTSITINSLVRLADTSWHGWTDFSMGPPGTGGQEMKEGRSRCRANGDEPIVHSLHR